MKKLIVFGMTLMLVLGAIAPVGQANVAGAEELPFSDIAKHWAKDNILKAYESGLVDGFPDGTFRPDAVVTGDQFLVMMLRAHSVTVDGKTEFDPEWFDKLEEYQPTFLNTIKLTVKKQNFNFQNASNDYWAKPYVDFIYDTPVLKTWDTVFPKDYALYKKQIKREEASYLLGQWFTSLENSYQDMYIEYVIKNSGLKDFNNFGLDVGAHRASMLISGIMNGYPTMYFYPKRYVTRAEALTMAQRLRDPSLRKPFTPNLQGQYYTLVDTNYYLFSDKYKFDFYNTALNLAKKHVTTGFIHLSGGNAIEIFKSEDERDKFIYMTKTMQFTNRPLPELIVSVDPYDYKTVSIDFPFDTTFPNTKAYLNAAYELLAGGGKGAQLKSKVDSLVKEGLPENFTFNGKKYTFYNHGKTIELTMYY
ncbi:S-layer homology domain-containing protein [Paenibacillus sp. PL2-23]|uniref:S-layer homology domain-containing protein n=1 Tax=Paenibacillus sp. PL2-23 TaxID=2100729 RepID=UPI0030FCC502